MIRSKTSPVWLLAFSFELATCAADDGSTPSETQADTSTDDSAASGLEASTASGPTTTGTPTSSSDTSAGSDTGADDHESTTQATDTDAPPSDVPLANDPGIFGPIPEGAFYLFREPYITTMGNPPVITHAVNVDNPGTRDLTFPNPPRWLPNGGADGRGAAQFDGIDDHGTATGFSFGVGSTPSILVVLQFDDVADRVSVGAQLHATGSDEGFLNAAHIRTLVGDVYRANGHVIGVPHHIDYLTPHASNDIGPHLHETHAYASGMVAVYDGTIFDGGGGSGLAVPVAELRVGTNTINQYAAAQISEIVITEGRTPSEAAAYRDERVRLEYPSLGL